MKEKSLPKTAGTLALLANGVFLVYLSVFACAQPSGPLIAAVLFEVVFFMSMLAYRIWRSRTESARQAEAALQYLEHRSKVVFFGRNGFALAGTILSACACLLMLTDLAALLLANSGQRQAAVSIYSLIAPPVVLGLHPAFTLEMLAGAYIQAGKFDKAEELEFTVVAIRKSVAGEKHELTAAIYADLGDLYRRAGKPNLAEASYRKSISLSKAIRYSRGYGSPLTKLASLLRDEQRFSQAEEAYGEALAVREKIFGKKSLKVAETLKEYSLLKLEEGQIAAAESMEKRADAITSGVAKRPVDRLAGLIPLVVLCFSFLIVSQRDRILVKTAAALSKKGAPQTAAVALTSDCD